MYIDRDIKRYFNKLVKHYDMVALVGPRQAGKTTFLKHHMTGVNSSYVLFDDPDARSLFDNDINKFKMQYLDRYDLSVLDEVQQCGDAGRKLKYLVDTGSNLWITSSSEIILGMEILSFLVGRVSIIKLYPFNLNEFLVAKEQKAMTSTVLERNIWEHVTYGGYPKVVTTSDLEMKRTILRDLYETMILKDAARTFSIEDLGALERLAKYIALNTGGILSYETLTKALNISFQTLKKYLDAIEKSYLTRTVTPFFSNKSKEISKQPKVYCLDTGLRNIVANRFDPEVNGKLFENYILSELIKMGLTPKYWRSKAKAEVDFIIEKTNDVIPIEVKLSAEPKKVERSLRSFINAYGPETAVVVSLRGKKGQMKINNCDVIFTDVPGMTDILSSKEKTK